MGIGKRPCILLSLLVFFAGSIWSFKATSINGLLGARILASLGAGSCESLGPSIIGDLFRERYFATAMAFFSLFLAAGSQVGPCIAGYLIADRGWRWFFKLTTILIGCNLFFCIFSLPETSYRRPYIHDGETAAEVDKEAEDFSEHFEKGELQQTATGTPIIPSYAGSYWKDLVSFRDRSQEEGGLKAFPKQLSLPFRFLLVPAALYAAVLYGCLLGG
jgi:MFS family permease